MKNKPFLALKYILSGIGYGIPVTLICMTLIGGYREPIGELAVWTVASAIIGLLTGATFGSDRLSLPGALAIHGTASLIVAVIAASVCGYGDSLTANLMGVLPVFLIIYAVIYAINYFFIKLEEKRVNHALREQTD